MAVNSAARVWSPYKELLSTVESAIHHKQPDAIQDLEVALRKHKPDFISLLKNPAKNVTHRQSVQKANKEGLPVQGQPTTQLLSSEFIEEALIISDLFDLNEFAAVELLLDGENQQSQFPGLSRGLVAVLLYYDGRVALITALKTLLQARPGLTWAVPCSDMDLQNLITKYTDELMRSGLINNILGALQQLSLTGEISHLEKQRAIGSPRHRRAVLDKLSELRAILAECVFCAACQARLKVADTKHLLQALKSQASLDADASLDDASTSLLMAALYCFDLHYLDHSDAEEAEKKLPLLSEPDYVSQIHRELAASTSSWAVDGIQAVLQFAWAVMLRQLSQYTTLVTKNMNDCCEQDDQLMDLAIERDVFLFLRSSILSKESFHKEQDYVAMLHRVLTDFLVLMPLKVKELRNRGDETARIIVAHQQEGLEPPTGPRRDFEHLLLLISELYRQSPHGSTFAADYWCAEVVRSPGGMMTSASTPDIQISLNKFVRLAGDLLPPPLYIPYINMLAGLANGPTAAHHTYNLLKANGQAAGGSVSAVSWEHFFTSLSQYYSSLRAEAPVPVSDLAHVYRGAGGHGAGAGGAGGARVGISAQEVDGLLAWLELTRTVATHDEGARVALVENQAWLPLVVLLGLVACPIPPRLKAALLRVLAAFSRTPDIAASLWHAIEHAQIIPTVLSSSGRHSTPGGLQVELEEVEARQEEFPMTLAFLSLVRALTDSPIPAGLGAGYRAPGFQPYLTFLRDSVFLKFNTRAYRDPAEKWEVGAAVLEILHKLLASHKVYREDFMDALVETPGGAHEGTVANKPPGHTLLLHMLNDSAMLRMILYIIDESTKQFEKQVHFPGEAHLERASLLCLRMVESALQLQDDFLAAVRDTGAGVMATSIDKLLLAINPRSGSPDHLVNIAKFVTWSGTLSSHALSAVRILHTASQCPLVQPKLVGLLSGSPDKELLLHGFVECLEAEEDEDEDQDEEEEEDMRQRGELNTSTVRSLTRQTILQLLLATLDQPAPNLAHFLLGFNLNKAVIRTNLQDPGVLGSPRTCLHSVLCLLERGLTEQRAGGVGSPGSMAAYQLAYHLIYRLCANPDTSSPTMRYLRSTHDFLQRYLQHVPFTPPPGASQNVVTSLLNQQSWLLKSLAIELRLTSSNRQRSHTQRLMSLMLEDNPSALSQKVLGPDGVYEPDYSQYDTELSLFNATSQMQYNQALTGGSSRRRLLAVLSCLELSQPAPPTLELEFLSPGMVEQAIESRQSLNDNNVLYCDVRQLHAEMMAELNANPAANTGHRKLIIQEIEAICKNVLERNTYREALHSKRNALEAWRQVVEIILTACPADLLAGELRHNVLLELLQDLLMKVSREDTIPELSSSIAGVILTLMANLRHCFLGDQDPAHLTHFSASLLDATALPATNRNEGFGHVTGARTMYASSLQVVLKGLIDFLISSSSGAQRVRANLYGALLYFLQIGQKPRNMETERWSGGGGGMLSRLTGKESEYDKLTAENVATLTGYGDNLMDIVCRDACDGHHVCRMLSLAVLDAIFSMEQRRSQWLSYLSSRGYLQHIIESLAHDDQELQAMLQPQPQPLKALYIFESKMGLLTRVAESSTGAHMLLQCGLMARLAECTVFDLRPEADQHSEGFIPTVLKRYRYQILFPVLKLCVAMLTSLGLENVQGSQHVLRFIVAHVDIFHAILHGGGGGSSTASAALDLEALQELALTTAVLSRAATQEGESDSLLGDAAVIEFRSHLSRLQRQMIALLPKYCLSDRLLKQIKSLETGGGIEGADMKIRIQLSVEEIACNVVAFCRGIVSKSGASVNAPCFRLLFGPSLDVPPGSAGSGEDPVVAPATAASRPQSLGLLVLVLRQATSLFLTAFDEHKQTQRKMHTVADLGVEEIKELCDGSPGSSGATGGGSTGEKVSAQQRQQIARCRLAQLLHYKQRHLQLFSYIVENSLYLLWRHLDFYLLHCVTTDTSMSLFRLTQKQHIRRLQDSPMFGGDGADRGYYDEESEDGMSASSNAGVSKEQLDTLKQTVCHVINDSLLTRLTDIEQCYSRDRTRYGFMEALIRRIKRLLKLHTA